MATWNADGGWKPFSFSTTNKTDYNANDFLSDYPNTTPDAFASTYPANLPTSRAFWIKRNSSGAIVDISWTEETGPNWNQRTLRAGATIEEQFSSGFRQDLQQSGFLDNVQNKRNELNDNASKNEQDLAARDEAAYSYNQEQQNKRNTKATQTNTFNSNLNRKNETLNNWSSNLVNYASNTQSGTYLTSANAIPKGQLDDLLNQGLLTQSEYNNYKSIAKTSFDTYYLAKKVGEPWDAVKLGALDPTGKFNADDYASYNPDAVRLWNEAVAQGNLDITARYTKDTFLWQNYTTYGKFAGYRGSKPVAETETEAYKYKEALTDYEKQLYRDQVLGITTDPSGKQSLVIASPQYDEEGNLINTGDVDTLLEKTFAGNISGDDARREKQLGALAQDLLQISIQELKKAKQEESNLGLLSQLPGYSEIVNINSTLANSIIGDSGIGGLLSLTGNSSQYLKDLEKDLGGITGVSSNSTIYNWQKWFDETLLKRYEDYTLEGNVYTSEKLKTLQDSAKEEIAAYNKDKTLAKPIYLEIAEKYKTGTTFLDVNNAEDFKKIMFYIDKESNEEFVKSFVDGYLKPRFDQSKSMDEFISYLDVKEEEQNVFQSQTTINKLKQIADLRAKSFIDLVQLAERTSTNFNADFYLDPVKNNTKEVSATKLSQYAFQKDLIANDFEDAKNGKVSNGINWAVEAYRYGFEKTYKTDPKVFAKLHYQVKGSTGAVKDASGKAILLDPAEDILPYEELAQKIKDFGVEIAARREFYGGAGFMKFVTPEEFADAVLGSVSPEENKEEWDKILASIGLEGTDATVQQVKEYLIDQLRTEEAKNIRESINYLNENQQEINQKTLGASYIERPTDVKEVTGERTVLYDVFKNAGYGGTEDEFYTDFFPDIDRTEQDVISKITSGKGLQSAFGDMDSPFSAFTNISNLFGDDDTSIGGAAFLQDQEDEDSMGASQSSYFKIFEDEDLPERSAAAASFLDDFTSLFKGFS